MYEIYFRSGADHVDARGDGEIDVFDDVGTSAFGSEHITVAEVVHRVRSHKELVDALAECIEAFADLGIDATGPVIHARAAIAKAKGTKRAAA